LALLDIINAATAAEEALFVNHGETEITLVIIDKLKRVLECAIRKV
jgi:hypothetical protein